MEIKSIVNLSLFMVLDESKNKTYYGGSQAWYPTTWQRLAGCGPTAASNIFFYLTHTQPNLELEGISNSKENWVTLMGEMWKYVTPSIRGVNILKMLYEPLVAYAKSKGLDVGYHICEVPKDKYRRPNFKEVMKFLEEALEKDAPIAFLNLCNGEEKNLDRWHWVTIISIEHTEDINRVFVNILDAGMLKRVDLALWYNTSTLGGGFVYFTKHPSED